MAAIFRKPGNETWWITYYVNGLRVRHSLRTSEQQTHPILGAGYDTVAAEFAAEDLNLCFQEPDTGIATRSDSFDKEVCRNIEPVEHVIESRIAAYERRIEQCPTFWTPTRTWAIDGSP